MPILLPTTQYGNVSPLPPWVKNGWSPRRITIVGGIEIFASVADDEARRPKSYA
jgi:hypothetical protein